MTRTAEQLTVYSSSGMHVGTSSISIGTLRSWKTTDFEPSTDTRLDWPAVSCSRIRCGVRPSLWIVAACDTDGTATAATTATAAAMRMRDIGALLGEGSGRSTTMPEARYRAVTAF